MSSSELIEPEFLEEFVKFELILTKFAAVVPCGNLFDSGDSYRSFYSGFHCCFYTCFIEPVDNDFINSIDIGRNFSVLYFILYGGAELFVCSSFQEFILVCSGLGPTCNNAAGRGNWASSSAIASTALRLQSGHSSGSLRR